jgi:(p)ppGpp synthase/HD superfamily hydrolase
MSLAYKAQRYATECHHKTNHMYGDVPYFWHISSVATIAEIFKSNIPDEDWEDVLSACWCHDVIEDTRQTYNDVRSATNERVAEIVYALTNEKGRNRAERGSSKYYQGIRKTKYATFVKLCDRIANVKHSIASGSKMTKMYREEQVKFQEQLDRGESYSDMWRLLNQLLEEKI